jgi:hypothetical protein
LKERKEMEMDTYDSVNTRIHTFPIGGICKLEDLDTQIPGLVEKNKQVYELIITLLQQHPCYLINWITAACKNQIDLFDDHPLAFEEHNDLA